MFVGYADSHAGDCYEMLNLQTRHIMQSRDIQWLNCMYYATDNNDNLLVTSAPKLEEQEVDSVAEADTNNMADTNGTNGGGLANSDNTDVSDDSDDKHPTNQATQTRSRQTITAPTRLIKEIDSSMVEDIMAVGAGIGGGLDHTSELRPMKYEEAMSTPNAKWGKSVDMEHDRMLNHVIFKAIKKSEVPKFTKILTSTWAMKQKADNTLRAQVTARGYKQ